MNGFCCAKVDAVAAKTTAPPVNIVFGFLEMEFMDCFVSAKQKASRKLFGNSNSGVFIGCKVSTRYGATVLSNPHARPSGLRDAENHKRDYCQGG